MRTLLSLLAAALLLAVPANAQTLQLRDGTAVPTLALRRDGDTLIARIKTTGEQVGELGYPLANLLRIDFPEPALLRAAPDLIDKGQADEAARQLAPAVAYYLPFYNVPGNYWKALALLQLDAFSAAHRDKDADVAAGELNRLAGADPDVSRLLRTRQADAILRRGDAAKALEILAPLASDESVPAASLAPVWVAQGAASLERRDHKAALLAFLRVPVYAPERTRYMPAALLGSARAYLGLDDKHRAEDALNQLLSTYPNAAEAAEARQQLQRLGSRPANPTPGS